MLKQITTCIKSLRRFFDIEEEAYDLKLSMPREINTISFKDVTFEVDGTRILDCINFTVHRYEHVCRYKFNVPLVGYAWARQKYDFDDETKKSNYFFLEDDYLKKNQPQCANKRIAFLHDETQSLQAIREMIQELGDNLDAI